jgi:enoyl-CoA hydratase
MTTHIYARKHGSLGRITLNRPKALNALTTEMCAAITTALKGFETDSSVGAVLFDGAGDKAFCAGGDVIMLHDSGKAGDSRAEDFWRVEYALDDYIARYPKPTIVLMDGVVMGGGVGLAMPCRMRVAGDTTLFAMPETGIGYFPDVGGSWFLPRLGTAIGNWLGLTGARLKTAQVCALDIANAFVPSGRHSAFTQALADAPLDGTDVAVATAAMDFVRRPPQATNMPPIMSAFSEATVPAILRALDADGSAWSKAQAENLRKKSPLALAVTLEALRNGANLRLREALSRELDISLGFLKTQDFYEGIRAQLIDKDRNPKWSHESAADVTQAQVARVLSRHTTTPLAFLS